MFANTEGGKHDNKNYRHAAYTNFIHWHHEHLGAGRRTPVPSCVCWLIRRQFPSDDGTYKGYNPVRS